MKTRWVVKYGIPYKSPYVLHCPVCKKTFEIPVRKFNDGRGFFCSRKCANKNRRGEAPWNKGLKGFMAGEKNPSWKGGRIDNGHGYTYVLNKSHPNATKMGYVMEHRLAMEKQIGRYLKPDEVVHHIDGNIANNNISNLKLFSNQSDHIKHHHTSKD